MKIQRIIGTIYLITNVVNGKIYVGQTWSMASSRFRKHFSGVSGAKKLCEAIRREGIKNFKMKVLHLEIMTQQKMDDLETFYIKKFRSNESAFGYNLTTGGRGGGFNGPHTIESRVMISETLKGQKKSPKHCRNISRGKKGRHFSARHCQNIGKSKKGAKYPNRKRLAKKYRQNISETQKIVWAKRVGNDRVPWNKGMKYTVEVRKRMSDARKAFYVRKKAEVRHGG